jgi:hypothetical protein
MPIPDSIIVGLEIRQAEFGLVQKQKRWLLGLETSGLEGLAAVIGALTVTTRLGRKNAALLAAAGQKEFPAQHSWLRWQRSRRLERRSASGRSTTERVRNPSRWRWVKKVRVRSKQLSRIVMIFKPHRSAP